MTQQMEFDSFAEFYPFYISQHSKTATRVVHVAGTGLAALNLVKSLAVGPRKQAFLTPVIGYGFAWFSHFVIEKNRPATFGYPAYSFLGDFRMLYDMARGRNAELQELADDYLAMLEAQEHAEQAAAAIIEEHPDHTVSHESSVEHVTPSAPSEATRPESNESTVVVSETSPYTS